MSGYDDEGSIMPQSKIASLTETIVNTLIGLFTSFIAMTILYKAYDVHVPHTLNIVFTFWMTLISIARGYIVRRMWDSRWWGRIRWNLSKQ